MGKKPVKKKPAAKKPAAKKPAAKKPAAPPPPHTLETPNEFIARTSGPPKRGASRMREFGYRQVVVWFDASEFKTVEDASIRKGMPVATFVRRQAHKDAVDILFDPVKETLSALANGQK